MREPRESKSAVEERIETTEQPKKQTWHGRLSRTYFFGSWIRYSSERGTGFPGCQRPERVDTEKSKQDHSASNPGPENKALFRQNPNSNFLRRQIPEY